MRLSERMELANTGLLIQVGEMLLTKGIVGS